MACGCAQRMRGILKLAGYTLVDGEWTKGGHMISDDRIEEDHTKVLIETMEKGLFAARAKLFSQRLLGGKP